MSESFARNSSITIGDTTVAPGERAAISLPIADLYTGSSVSMPVKVICGRRAGPVLFVSAAIHGDELNGVEIIRRLLKRKILKGLQGTLIAVPVVNVHGFLDQSRYLPDRRDLNRSFPGSARGSIAARLANTFIKQIVSQADCGIDLHTGAINRFNLPQIRANIDDAKTLALAKAFGAPVILNSDIRDGSLRACASERGFPMLIYEAGEALRFDDLSIRAGISGILKVMRFLGMLPQSKTETVIAPVIAESTSWVRAPASGIVNQRAQLGARVVEGQRIAIVGDPQGDHEEPVIAPCDGIVIARSNLPLAHEGDALFHIAAFKGVAHVEDKLEQFAATHAP
ncbi:MAG: succinylglutamate desuccinylase/aspartoacylase family protein [Gammaproteobacteria bacterium]|nr:succinylglutamate desuccinylase/aspartoacylase family protein [Gammaproteobacteria bacterium]MDH5302832.1 succinylglutamate desuccinylase/aspartoacylase family protein [Gammaproteobacteria bacterium]MDH5321631.1 succinylglutamate desuccinylase/aspartoacylase family protein [Gammaproteobacteria bacterium]